MERIKVLLVDDHDIVLDGIESLLNDNASIQVVGKANSVAAAKDLVGHYRPDLVLTDISMGAVSGLDLTRQLTAQYPLIKVLVLSMHDSVEQVGAALEAGAAGYLLKNVKQEELFTAIATVMSGRQYLQHAIAGAYGRARQRQLEARRQSGLTPRETEILRLIVQGQTTADISHQLFLSEHTVETHRKNIGRKTGVKTLIGLLNYARENGLL